MIISDSRVVSPAPGKCLITKKIFQISAWKTISIKHRDVPICRTIKLTIFSSQPGFSMASFNCSFASSASNVYRNEHFLKLCSGFLGNIAAIFLLTRPQIRCCFFNQLLILLATFDLLYIMTMMIESLGTLGYETNLYIELFPVFLFPVNHISMTGSIFTTVGVTVERFLAVHKPHYYNQIIKNVSTHRLRLLKYSLTISVLAVVFNIPKFLEGQVLYDEDDQPYNFPSDLRYNYFYNAVYHCWVRLIFLGIIPFALISSLNIKVYLAIKKLRKRNEKQEECLCIILITIVLVFFICNLPRLILNIHETFNLDQIYFCSQGTLLGE